MRRRRRHALPGFGLTLGLSLSYLALIVLIPLAALVLKSATIGPLDVLARPVIFTSHSCIPVSALTAKRYPSPEVESKRSS